MLVYFILKRILIIRKKDTGYSDRCKKKKKKTQREQVKTAKNLLNMLFFFQIQSRTKANIVTGKRIIGSVFETRKKSKC